MSTVQLYTHALLQQHAEATMLLLQLNESKDYQETLRLRADIESRIKEMKAIYFDLMEAGGPDSLKVLIKHVESQYEGSPEFDDYIDLISAMNAGRHN